MNNVVHKKCFCGNHQPSFGMAGERATHCAACRTDEMVDVIHQMCFCGNHSSPAWAPLCYECYVLANPEDPIAKGVKKTERLIGAFFNEELVAGMEPGVKTHNMMSVHQNRGADWFGKNEYDYFLLGGHVIGHCDGPHHFRDTSYSNGQWSYVKEAQQKDVVKSVTVHKHGVGEWRISQDDVWQSKDTQTFPWKGVIKAAIAFNLLMLMTDPSQATTVCCVKSQIDTQYDSYIASLLAVDAIGGRVFKLWKTPNSDSFTVLKCNDGAHTYWTLKSDFDLRKRSVPLIALSPAASPQTLEGAFSRQRASSSSSSSSRVAKVVKATKVASKPSSRTLTDFFYRIEGKGTSEDPLDLGK